MTSTTRARLAVYQAEAARCTTCHPHGLVHVDETRGIAKPMLQRSPTGSLGILIVGEAPNWGDTYKKGYLTYDPDTDPTGRFMRRLLIEEVGLAEQEIDDVLFTNGVMCLPTQKGERFPVSAKQSDLCKPWLVRLIEDAEVKVVVTMGGKPLEAVNRIERHGLTLKDTGALHPWFGRQLLPLFHAGQLARNLSRAESEQRQDIRVLRSFLGR